ncbi:MAG: hypothetical protein PHV07_01555 [Oscillospiraceae bacterium]|nr:hypothetical protein [Oscillospiraceae bacterium]
MNDKLLTVKEVAETAGVSTQSVYKLMKDKLQTYIVEVANQKMLKAKVLSEHYNIELQTITTEKTEELQTDTTKLQTVANQGNFEFMAFLKEEIKNKNTQLENKDKIILDKESIIKDKDKNIIELTATITELTDRLATLFENSQQLQQNQQLLEAKYQESEEQSDTPKKGFFKKMFNKK